MNRTNNQKSTAKVMVNSLHRAKLWSTPFCQRFIEYIEIYNYMLMLEL